MFEYIWYIMGKEDIPVGEVGYSCIWGHLWWANNGLCNNEENSGSLSLCDY